MLPKELECLSKVGRSGLLNAGLVSALRVVSTLSYLSNQAPAMMDERHQRKVQELERQVVVLGNKKARLSALNTSLQKELEDLAAQRDKKITDLESALALQKLATSAAEGRAAASEEEMARCLAVAEVQAKAAAISSKKEIDTMKAEMTHHLAEIEAGVQAREVAAVAAAEASFADSPKFKDMMEDHSLASFKVGWHVGLAKVMELWPEVYCNGLLCDATQRPTPPDSSPRNEVAPEGGPSQE